ncbi:MAG: ATP-dependent helicase [Actinomycetia bacterium]|nr:ATP-dependent helicase [Actinomycetes bacterium]
MSVPAAGLTRQGICDLFGIPFTDEQLDAIAAPHAPAVVIAGAGSGKTALMSARVIWLVSHGEVTPDQVLGLTFTNKAAAELSTRVRKALRLLESPGGSPADGEPTVSTYHSYAAALLREYGLWAGYEPAAQLLTDAQRIQLAESVVRRAPGPFPALGLRLTALTERVLTLDGELNDHLVDLSTVMAHDTALIEELDAVEELDGKLTADPAKARTTAHARLELAPLVAEFRRVKAQRERVDFGDQMASAAILAETVSEVARGERERFGTVLLDEYQDTSMAQQRLLVALFGAGHPVMAVGDPFQSIYGWRGASVRNILTFDSDFGDPEPAPIFALGQNNRSGGAILRAANAVAEPLRWQFPEVAELRPQPAKADRGDVTIGLYRTAAEEIEVVCDAVAAEVAEGRAASDIAILCRESKVFPAVISGLTERGVPVDVVGLRGLLELPEIVEVVSTLEVLYDPTTNPSLVRLLGGPRWRIGPADLAQLGARARELAASPHVGARGGAKQERDETVAAQLREAVAGIDPAETVSLIEALEDAGPGPFSTAARERFAELAEELRQLRAVIHQPPDVAIARVISVTGLDIELATHGVAADHLDALLEQARGFTASGGGPGVGAFLSYLALVRRYGSSLAVPAPSGGDGVALLTVHKAKGLEWHSVYVPQVVDGVFPSAQSRSTPLTSPALLPYPLRGDAADFPVVATWTGNKGVAAFKADVAERERGEDRRLAYVAMTRAAERLVVTGHRWGYTQATPRDVSPYLQALANVCAAGGGTVLHWQSEVVDVGNPALTESISVPWPPVGNPEVAAAREAAAFEVFGALQAPALDDGALDDADSRERVASWDADIAALIAEAERQSVQVVELPSSLSASWAVELLREPEAAARRLQRPMPRPPAAAAHRGTRFHQWVEARFGQVPLIDVDGLVPEGEAAPDDDLKSLQEAFLAGPYADREPVAVEAPFHLVLGEQIVVGRIDAVYGVDPNDPELPVGTRYEVVDWKTGRHAADPLQLALYRIAWAELHQIPVDQVVATFYHVSSGRVERPVDLPDRPALAEWWSGSTA